MRKEITKSIDKFFLVSNQPLFQDLSNKEKAFIANRSQVGEYNKNDIIYNEGERRDFFYIVLSGRVSLFHPLSKARAKEELTVEILRKGDYFGIISLLTERPHSVTARAINDARILKVDEKSFRQILKKIPHLGIHLSRSLSRRLKIKHTGIKEIFQSTIISVYYDSNASYVSDYIIKLALSIKKESGKRAIVLGVNKRIKNKKSGKTALKNIYVDNPKEISPLLNNFTGNYHFVLVDLPVIKDDITVGFLKQSDLCHLICEDPLNAAKRIRPHVKEIPGYLIKIISTKSDKKLSMPVYATLPQDKKEFDKTVRRIARETAGVLIGLALGSGGAIGLAQVGILKVLEKENIPIDILAGTSIGALIGSLWVSGYRAREIEKICAELNTKLKALTLVDITFPKRGLLAGRRVRNFLLRYLGNRTFHDVKMPFKVVACDIRTREEVVISSGKLIDAVTASVAIPGIFNPHQTNDGKLLVDGGITSPVPIGVLSKSGVKRIIAVNSMPSPEDAVGVTAERQTILDIIVNSFYSMEYRIGKYASQEADVYIHPILKGAAWYEFYRAKEFIRLGEKEARKTLPRIRELIKR